METAMHDVMFVHSPLPELQEAAFAIFEALGLDVFEERESSNYPPENRYFIGYAANASLKVCRSDDDRLPHPYWVILGQSVVHRAGLMSIPTDVPILAAVLAGGGLEVFVPSKGWSKTDWNGSGDVYRGQID
ncbi:hypothetical protein [Janthinobacterium fluminis]|uniref:Uncharacterized protein n=1 Tax=Janthinobacterium fluminis TaxID=2987524 RepID=A0ABT5K425_9BURK|nr:hypothetical protein [Janthinobacterium fluminis]MDC8758487.1 hypothetical protein [Janthinobacterium fluminis]